MRVVYFLYFCTIIAKYIAYECRTTYLPTCPLCICCARQGTPISRLSAFGKRVALCMFAEPLPNGFPHRHFGTFAAERRLPFPYYIIRPRRKVNTCLWWCGFMAVRILSAVARVRSTTHLRSPKRGISWWSVSPIVGGFRLST